MNYVVGGQFWNICVPIVEVGIWELAVKIMRTAALASSMSRIMFELTKQVAMTVILFIRSSESGRQKRLMGVSVENENGKSTFQHRVVDANWRAASKQPPACRTGV